MTKKAVKTKCAKRKAAKGKSKANRLPVSVARVRAAALACGTLAEAAGVLDVTPPLEECLASHPVLAEAWERGMLLRKFRLGIASAATVSDIARELKMEPTALRDLIATDRIVGDIFNEESYRVRMSIRAGYLKIAESGETSATGLSRIERLFRDWHGGESTGPVGTDIDRVPQEIMTKLLGVTRQTLHEWFVSKALPRNPDGSYNLRDVLPWYRTYIEQKMVATGPRAVMPGGATRMQTAKARKVELEVGELEGRLWRREEVVDHWIGLAQVAANTLSRQTAVEMGDRLAGRTDEEVTMELERMFRDLRRDLASLPDSVELPPATIAAYAAVVATLEPQNE